MNIIDRRNKKSIRLKIIKPVFETLTVNIDDLDVESPLTGSQRVYDLFKFLIPESREHFFTLHLDSKNRIVAIDRVSTGSMNANVVHPRDVLKSALFSSAAGIICVHNHPSGEPTPSREDHDITKRLNEATDVMGIRLLDHVIIGDGAYVSFADRGLIETSNPSSHTIIKTTERR